MIGAWNPSEHNRQAGYNGSVFGPTSLVINNECTGEERSIKHHDEFYPGSGGENRRIKVSKRTIVGGGGGGKREKIP